jgi:hypothetical protein
VIFLSRGLSAWPGCGASVGRDYIPLRERLPDCHRVVCLAWPPREGWIVGWPINPSVPYSAPTGTLTMCAQGVS